MLQEENLNPGCNKPLVFQMLRENSIPSKSEANDRVFSYPQGMCGAAFKQGTGTSFINN